MTKDDIKIWLTSGFTGGPTEILIVWRWQN